VSIVIPVRNERGHIEGCLRSVLAGSYPLDRMEVLVVDGMSDDGTRELVLACASGNPAVRLFDNPARIVPSAMNIGIRAARGELIVRIDAHAHYGEDYVAQLVHAMETLVADNVGGIVVTRAASNSAEAQAVSIVLSHPFGVGDSTFRLARPGPPIEVDTVPFGCYRRDVFERIGLYDEMFIRNQDDELNARLRMAGGRIFLCPDIRIDYVARDSLRKLARMLNQYGYFKPLVAIKLGRPATLRQLAPPAFTAALVLLPIMAWLVPESAALWAGALLAHALINVVVSGREARRRGRRVFPYLIAGFLLAHVAYGFGYLRGILDFGILRRHRRGARRDLALSR
jgi:glycosyltransferase involved in cell wall biosynthesis